MTSGRASSARVVRLTPADAERYVVLRRQMLLDSPWAFSASLDDDRGLDAGHMRSALAEPENAIVAAEDAGTLVGSTCIFRAKSPKFAHRAQVWGVFVGPQHRGTGLGRALLTAAIELARGWNGVDYVDLGVSQNAQAAQKLYASLGFEAWGREPESTQLDGKRYDEIFMALRLAAR